jgi:hypothetical protein
MTDTAFKKAYSSAAKRCADIVNAAVIIENAAGNYNERWLAIRLADGGSDGVTYDTRANAVRHQISPEYCAFILAPPNGMEPREAEIFLNFHRKAHDAGFRVTDPALISPITNEGMASQLNRFGT